MPLSQKERRALEHVTAKMAALASPDRNDYCAVDPAAKRAVKGYLDAWLIPVLAALLRTPGERTYSDEETLRYATDPRDEEYLAIAMGWRRADDDMG